MSNATIEVTKINGDKVTVQLKAIAQVTSTSLGSMIESAPGVEGIEVKESYDEICALSDAAIAAEVANG